MRSIVYTGRLNAPGQPRGERRLGPAPAGGRGGLGGGGGRFLPSGSLGFAFSMDTTNWSSGGLEPFLNLAIVCLLENLDPLHVGCVNQYAIQLWELDHCRPCFRISACV